MGQYDALLRPLTIKGITIRNRVMSTAHTPSYSDGTRLTERYIRYHEEKAKGGIGLTMFGGSSGVAPDSPGVVVRGLHIGSDAIIPDLQTFADRMHKHGAAAMIQVSHRGRHDRWDAGPWMPTISASPVRENTTRSMPREMEDWDIRRIVRAYGQGVRRCVEGGLDGCELGAAGHLIDQFWTPSVNRRTDRYGGSLENRLRFGLEVFEEVRKVVGDDYVVGMRMSGDELIEDGLTPDELMQIARTYVDTGMVDFLNVIGANLASKIGVAHFIPGMAFPVAPYLHLASAIKAEVDVPIFHAARIADIATAARAVDEGHVDMVAMTRAHIADPHIVKKLMEDRVDDIRQCVGESMCIDRMTIGKDTLCAQNAATGREETMPHVIDKADQRRRVVVVGAGPGGLEAARVSAERGHDVVLLEKQAKAGGQINLAARHSMREQLTGIPRWLEAQARKLGVDVRLETEATADMVMAENPDIVVVATGGRPHPGNFKGADLTVSSHDILSEAIAPAENAIIYDENAQHHGPTCAEFMAERGSLVELAVPDRAIAEELGATNFPIHLRELFKHDVVMSPGWRLKEVTREGNKLVAVLANVYADMEEERLVDQVVLDFGTLPCDELYFALKPHSSNLGEVDLEALVQGRPQSVVNNPDGTFALFRIGDAVTSRNIHAAVFDALRLCKEF